MTLPQMAIGRRELLLGVCAAAMTFSNGAAAQSQQARQAADEGWEAALKRILGEAKPLDGKIAFDIPEIAENGNTVPFTVFVDSPMTDKEYVRAVHVVSTGNPQSLVATYHFTPESGKASVSSRMRLAQTQDIIGVAELSDGSFAMVKRNVKVTIGGCGG